MSDDSEPAEFGSVAGYVESLGASAPLVGCLNAYALNAVEWTAGHECDPAVRLERIRNIVTAVRILTAGGQA